MSFTHPHRLLTFLLLLSFLQPWRLVASTPDAEDFLKYVAEQGICLFDEVIAEEGSINHQSTLNTAQTEAQAAEERIFRVTSPASINIHSVEDSTSTSSFSETEELSLLNEPRVSSLERIDGTVPSRQTMQLNGFTSEPAAHLVQMPPPQEVVSERLHTFKYNALRIYCNHWLADVVASKGQPTYADRALEREAYPQLIEAFKEYCEEVKASLDSGGLLTLSWIQVAEVIQQGIEDSIKVNNSPEGSLLAKYRSSRYFQHNIVNTTKQLAQFKAEVIRTTLLHQTPDFEGSLANEWRKIVEQSQFLAEHYSKGIQAAMTREEEEGEGEEYLLFDHYAWDEDYDSAKSSMLNFQKAAMMLKKASETEKNEEYSILRKTSKQYQIAAEYYRQAAKAYAQENKTEWKRLHYAANSTAEAAHHLKETSASLEKASESEQNGKNSIAALWIKSSEQYQIAAEYCRKKAKAVMLKNSEECQRSHNLTRYTDYTYLEQTARAACRSAQLLENAITTLERAFEAEKRGSQVERALLVRASEQRQVAAEYHGKASEACAVENRQEYTFFNHLAESYYASSKHLSEAASWLEKASEAEKGEQAVANLWKESAEQYQIAIDYKIKASEAKRLGNEEECTLFEHSANAIHQKIKADEARILGDEELSIRYNQGATYAENSVKKITANLSKKNKYTAAVQGGSEIEDEGVKSLSLGEQKMDLSNSIKVVTSSRELSSTSSLSTLVTLKKDCNILKYNALKIYCEYWLASTGVTKEGSAYVDKVIVAGGVDPQLVHIFNECCHHINASLDSGGFLALSWIQIAEDLQNAIEDSIKKDHEEPRWYENASDNEGMLYFPNYITPATLQLVKYKDELIRSSVLHQSPEIVNAWENIVRQSQHLVEYHRKSLSCVLEDNKKAPSFWAANGPSKESADLLKQTASNLKKASIADQRGKQSLSSLWLNAVNQNLLLLEQLQKTHQSDSFNFLSDQINNATKSSAECLRNSEAIIEEAIKADQRGMREEVILYEKAAFQYQQATDIYQKITETRLALNESLRGFIAAGASTKRSADYLDLAAKTLEDASLLEEHGHQEQALLDRAVAEQYQEAAECEGLAAEAYEQGNIADGDRLHEDANVIVQIHLLRKQALNYKVKLVF